MDNKPISQLMTQSPVAIVVLEESKDFIYMDVCFYATLLGNCNGLYTYL